MQSFRKVKVLILLILLIGIALRVYQLEKYDLWYDESIKAIDARPVFTLPPLINLFNEDFVIKHNQDYLALYDHSFLYLWEKIFGTSDFILRFSSVIIAILNIYLLYLLVKVFFNEKAALISALLLSVSPLHIHYSQELGSYIFVSLFVLIATYCFLKAIITNKKLYWLVYLFSMVINIYFHFTTLIFYLIFLLLSIIKLRKVRNAFIFAIFIHLFILILTLPLFLPFIALSNYFFGSSVCPYPKFGEFPSWSNAISGKSLLFAIKNFSIGYNINFYSFSGAAATLAFLAFFILGVYKYAKVFQLRVILIASLLPILIFYLASQIRPCFVYRYFFGALPFFLIVVSLGLSSLRKVFLGLILAFILPLNLFALKNYYNNSPLPEFSQHTGVVERLQGVKELSAFLAVKFKKGEHIFHASKKTIFPMKFYVSRDHDIPYFTQEVEKGSLVYVSEENKKNLLRVDYKGTHPSLGDFDQKRSLELYPRIWVILSSFCTITVPREQFPEYSVINLLKDYYAVELLKDFGDSRLYFLSRR